MRLLNYAQFKRLIRGVDLEYRITGYPISLEKKARFEDLHIPYDLNFFKCKFQSLEFKNCIFSGNVTLDHTVCQALQFTGCQLQNIILKDSTLDTLGVEDSREIRKLDVYNVEINTVKLENNPIFQELSLGCKNKIRKCWILDQGSTSINSFQTSVYLCPEQFESFVLKNISTDVLHIGTFGNYSKLSLANIQSDYVVFENCSTDTSSIEIFDLKSNKFNQGQIHFVNTAFDANVFKIKDLRPYFSTQIHHQKINIESLLAKV